MSPHPASFDSLGREDAQQGMQDDTEELSPRDATYDRTGDSLWKDGQESSSRQGPSGNARTSASSPAFPAAREDGDSMTAAEAAKLRLFKALRTAKACDVSFFFLLVCVSQAERCLLSLQHICNKSGK